MTNSGPMSNVKSPLAYTNLIKYNQQKPITPVATERQKSTDLIKLATDKIGSPASRDQITQMIFEMAPEVKVPNIQKSSGKDSIA